MNINKVFLVKRLQLNLL